MGYKYFVKGKSTKVSTHFDSTEFDCHGSGCCTQTIVNEKLIELLEKIREHFKVPITITSPYRCQIHNSRVGGAVGSRHSKGDAVDIVVKGVAPKKVAQYAESIGILGIGLYETNADGHFVHIDTRDYRSFWYGQSEQPRTTFGVYDGYAVIDTTINVNPSINITNTILNRGDSGVVVKELQNNLIRLGYPCGTWGADGSFGVSTEQAVRKFQKATGIGVDGIAGYQTLIAIKNAIDELENNNTNSYVGHKAKVTASVLNVRSGAGTNYQIIKQLLKDTVCSITEEKNKWCKLADINGWVSKDYIQKI